MTTIEPTSVLIVEDEAAHAEIIRRTLSARMRNTYVHVVGSLAEYRQTVEVLYPDIVLLDINLPDGHALDVLNDPNRSDRYPIMIMTSQGSEQLAVETLKAGALDYIVKTPETFAEMARIIERSLREWRTRQEHRQTLDALRASELRFRSLLQDVKSVAVQGYRPDGTVFYWNRASEAFYGYSAAEAMGRDLCDLIIPPAMQEEVRATMRQMAQSGEPLAAGELALRRKDGSEVVVYSSHAVLQQTGGEMEIYCIDIDITERKRADAQLRKLSLAVEQSPAAVVITDLDGVIEYVNPKFSDVTGYSLAEALGKNPRILQSGHMLPEGYQQLWQSLQNGEEWQGEFLNKRKDGRLIWERALISPLRDAQGSITHYIGVKEDITTQKNYEQQLEHQATHDHLTGLANRALLKDRLDQAIHYAQRSRRIVAVLLLDLDRFKMVNDSFGHAFGDELLCQVAGRLTESVRETDTVARLGGDEFLILLTEVAAVEDVRRVTTKILQAVARPYRIGERDLTLTASLGVSLYPRDSSDSTLLIRNADIAMYQSKRRSDDFTFYNDEMNLHLVETLELENDLRFALEREEFRLHYQPKVDLKTGRINGCEALLRWQHPQRGLVSPGDFIPLAEVTGLIVSIGTWALEEACRQNLAWQSAGLPPVCIAVNLSARQFLQGNLVEIVANILQRSGLDPALLELELTESMIMDDPVAAERTLQELKQLGVALSLDDFGTGYSSLNYLRRFPVDSLKVDQSFIHDVATDPTGASVVSSIIDIAHNLNLFAIAEGVETRNQLKFLVDCGCDAMQGYLFSRPLPADAFAALLLRGDNLHERLKDAD
ncbi:MAG: EAL domain-containing protein [Pelovirga sp.]